VTTIIARRVERLRLLMRSLDVLATSERAVPTAVAAPLLDKLRSEVGLLEKVLENDIAPQWETALPHAAWQAATLLSSEHKRLRKELDAVRALYRRTVAAQFTSSHSLARGQVGVAPPPPEESALARWARSGFAASPSAIGPAKAQLGMLPGTAQAPPIVSAGAKG